MASKITYETVIAQAKTLPVKDKLRLIQDLAAALTYQVSSNGQSLKTSADFYGVARGVQFDEADFEKAEWHPTSED